jgi:hypothetical protein
MLRELVCPGVVLFIRYLIVEMLFDKSYNFGVNVRTASFLLGRTLAIRGVLLTRNSIFSWWPLLLLFLLILERLLFHEDLGRLFGHLLRLLLQWRRSLMSPSLWLLLRWLNGGLVLLVLPGREIDALFAPFIITIHFYFTSNFYLLMHRFYA